MPKQSRKTKQKEVLLSELKQFRTFFTAEDLYERIQKKNPSIGIATVYRFLRDIRNEGLCHSYVCGKRTIYSQSKDNHCHYICTRCGKMEHFHVDNIDFIRSKVKGSITHFQVDVYGICDACLEKEK
ncbi:MAG: Fur family transcriptional regulator [Candidatus Woesearchaeota archaeon]